MSDEQKQQQSAGAAKDKETSGSKGETKVTSNTPEGAEGKINPSSLGDTGVTPGSVDDVA